MSDVINANPNVIDESALPTRDEKLPQNSKYDGLVTRILSLSLLKPQSPPQSPPGLVEDVDMASSSDELVTDDEEEVIDEQEIFDLIASISDPEHPLTLAQLSVVNLPDITVKHGKNKNTDISEILIRITPTITHCSLATLIGLGIRVRLERCLPPRFRIRILIKEGTHQSENQVNKQLNDKERVAAACENDQLLTVILQMLSTCK